MRLGSLFAGIGGFELAATWAGIEPVWSNEIDPFACKVLRKNFDHEIIEKDIREIGKENLPPIDIISGGFPCQPFSAAGKRKGTNDDRYLWPEMLRVIRELKPKFVIGENVAGLLSMENGETLKRILSDLENEGYNNEVFIIPACGVGAWHKRDRIWIIAKNTSSSGQLFGESEEKGAEVRELRNTSTGDSERIHRPTNATDSDHDGRHGSGRQETRSTNFIGDENKSKRRTGTGNIEPQNSDGRTKVQSGSGSAIIRGRNDQENEIATPDGFRGVSKKPNNPEGISGEDGNTQNNGGALVQEGQGGLQPPGKIGLGDDKTTPEEDKIRRGNDARGINRMDGKNATNTNNTIFKEQRKPITTRTEHEAPKCRSWWQTEPNMGRVANGIPNRVDRLKGLGNAIVPQVAYELFKAIKEEIENNGK